MLHEACASAPMASLESELHLLLARHRDHALHPVLAAALATFECSGTPPPADAAREMALLAHAKALDESIQKLQSQRADTMAGLAVFEKRRADERAAEEEVARQAAAKVARQGPRERLVRLLLWERGRYAGDGRQVATETETETAVAAAMSAEGELVYRLALGEAANAEEAGEGKENGSTATADDSGTTTKMVKSDTVTYAMLWAELAEKEQLRSFGDLVALWYRNLEEYVVTGNGTVASGELPFAVQFL